ncbi:MAG: class I SAM-dependent methyltransferase [Anaerolineae bacterium]
MPDSRDARLEEIVLELQAEIRRQRQAQGDFSPKPDLLARVRQTQWVNPHLPIGWPEMPRGIWAKLSAYAKKITRRLLRWYINPIVEQQNAFNAAVTEALHSLENIVLENRQLFQDATDQDWQAVQQQEHRYIDGLEAFVNQINRMVDGYLPAEREQLLAHDWEVLRQHQENDHQAEQRSYTAQLEKKASSILQAVELLRLRLQRLETRPVTADIRGASSNLSPAQAAPPVILADTFVIGGAFRNSSQMAERLGDYDDLLTPLVSTAETAQVPSLPILDLGCGRGDLVAHLKGLGLPVYGVDLDADAVTVGRNAGLDLRHEDAFAHLQGLDDKSLRAVLAIQVAEHLTIGQLEHLYQLVYRKLTPGGIVIIETINPVCLWALSNHFLLDPSHKTPLHPQMSQFLLEQAGFGQVNCRFLHPVPDDERLGWMAARPDSIVLQEIDTAMRANINRLNHFLYGPQDYAAIAFKPEDA